LRRVEDGYARINRVVRGFAGRLEKMLMVYFHKKHHNPLGYGWWQNNQRTQI
jgi:hypothetical protein